jgi:hypothetical protein
MAIGSKPVRRVLTREIEEKVLHNAEPKPAKKWRRRLAFCTLTLALLVWFLPIILAKTPLLVWAVNRFGNLHGQVKVQSASLGWFSAPSIAGIELTDEKNQPVLEVSEVSGSQSLLSLISNSSRLGSFKIDKPKLTLRLRSDGSNLEDVIANYMTGESSSKKIGVAIEIVDATVEIVDETAKRSRILDQFSASVKMPSAESEPMIVNITSGRFVDPQKPGSLTAKVKLRSLALPQSSAQAKSGDGDEISLKAENLPLDLLQPVLGRFMERPQLSGWLSAEIRTTAAEGPEAGKTAVQAAAAAKDFSFASAALGKDQIRLKSFRAEGNGTFGGDRIDIEQSTVDCDLGNVQLAGALRLKDGEGKSNLTAAGLMRQRLITSGRIDLARLAAMLPNYFRVRPQTQITSGEVQMAYSYRPESADAKTPPMSWQGQLQAVNVAAVDNGRPLSWPQPIVVNFAAHEEQRGIVVDALRCESEFLKISGSGTSDDLNASVSFDLKRLGEQLGQFVDIDQYQLAGTGWANSNWKRSAERRFEADSDVQIQNFHVALPGQLPWQEPSLVMSFAAKGTTDFTAKNTAIDEALAGMKAGSDQLTVQLTQPVKDLADGGVWPLHVAAGGQLQTWFTRAAAFAPLSGYRAAGVGSLDIALNASTASVTVEKAKIHCDQLSVNSPSINIAEPQLNLDFAGSWTTKDRQLNLRSAVLTNSTINVTADQFVLSMPTVQYRGNLDRLGQCFADPTKPATWGLGGVVAGNAQFKKNGQVVHCETAADVTNLTVVDSSGKQFQEPIIKLQAIGDYDKASGLVKIDQATISSTFLAANTNAKLGMKEQPLNQIDGLATYDLNRISALLRPSFGNKIRLVGQNTGPMAWRGPLSLAGGRAEAELKWDSAYLYGFQIGPAAIRPKLADGILAIEPMQVAVSQGKLNLAPKIRLAPDPKELTMPAGKLADHVQITTDMCEMFLKYIAPVLAEVTEARGGFSIELARCRLPLADPTMGELSGKFIVHNVEIGPGPLIRELAILMERETPARLRQEAAVAFEMRGGRVYHDNMELLFPDFTLRTRGSVGINDQTLELLAELPIPPKWLVNNPAAPALRNQTLALPIGGTLGRPQLDRDKLQQYTEQFIRKAATGMLEEGLKNGLDQLFGKPNQ